MQDILIAVKRIKGVPELSLDVRKSGVLALRIHDSAEHELSCSGDVTLFLDIRHHTAVSRAVADFNLALLHVHDAAADRHANAFVPLANGRSIPVAINQPRGGSNVRQRCGCGGGLMARHHGIDWRKADLRVRRLKLMRKFTELFPDTRVVIERGEPALSLPTNIYLNRWQWAKGRRTATLAEAIDEILWKDWTP